MQKLFKLSVLLGFVGIVYGAIACTGITLKSGDGAIIVSRTIETGHVELDSNYVIVPRGYVQTSYLPNGKKEGLNYAAEYGYVAFSVEENEFFVEGLNEAGLSAALFYFPGYGQYPQYDAQQNAITIADLQLVGWALGNFSTVQQVKDAIPNIRPTKLYPESGTVHWRFTDKSGRQIVLEYIDGKPVFYENELGVLTNSPDLDWQLKNLNNYVNLYQGAAPKHKLGTSDIELAQFGAGSGMLGLPGDFTPPSRFVRAAFLQTSIEQQKTGFETVLQAFHILNNFDIPVETEFASGQAPVWMPSATQWTIATDITNEKIYYHTMNNREIRMIDISDINFEKIPFQYRSMDESKIQPIVEIKLITD